MTFDGEIGLQFTIHIATEYTVPEIGRLAANAHDRGFAQVWVNDNLRYRNVFVALAAIAAESSIKLGTAVMVPYFRNPVDVADTVAALTELAPGRELSIGIGRGSLPQAGNQVETPKPYLVLRETTECLRALLDGEEIRFGEYPLLSAYFNLKPDTSVRMAFAPVAPIGFYLGGHGPVAATVAGETMDGLVIGGYFIPFVRSGRLGKLLETADAAARAAGREGPLRHVAEINVSVAGDPQRAKEFTKPYVSHLLMGMRRLGFADEEFESMGVDPARVAEIAAAFDRGATIEAVAELVTDGMVEAAFVTGDADACREQLRELAAVAAEAGFEQIVLAKLGPDYGHSIDFLAEEVLPAVRG